MSEFFTNFLVGFVLLLVGAGTASIKAVAIFKEQIKSLSMKIDKLEDEVKQIKAEKDTDMKEMKEELKHLTIALQEGQRSITDMIHQLHIKILEDRKK